MKKDNVRNLIIAALATMALASCGRGGDTSTGSTGTSTSSTGTSTGTSSTSTSSSSGSSTSSEDPDVKEANRVLALINALTEDSTMEEVRAARQAYEDLTARQKFLVESQGGLEKLEALEAAIEVRETGAEISARIEALNEDEPDEEEVVAIREAYDEFVNKYGGLAEQAVAPELIAKLVRCEKKVATKIINVWIAEARAADIKTAEGISRFTILSKDIDAAYEELTPEKKAAVEGYIEYDELKRELGDYATLFGAPYQAVDAEFAELEAVKETDFGHHYEMDYTDVDIKGEGNIQFYVPPSEQLETFDRIGFFASMPIECDLKFFNDGDVVAPMGHFTPNEWKFVTIDVNMMKKPTDYSVIAAWFEDRTAAKLPGFKLTQMVGLKKTYPANATIFSSIWLNSEISGWEKYDDIEEDPERGPLVNVSFLGAESRDSFQICWNNIPVNEAGYYSGIYQDIYNPTGSKIENILFQTIDNAWNTYETTYITLEPGWNKVSFPVSMFTHPEGKMLTAKATKPWSLPGWQFGRVYGIRPAGAEVDFGGLAINSAYTSYAAFPTATDPDHGEVAVLDLQGLTSRTDIIWNGVPHKTPGQFGLVYFWMYNPTSSKVDDLTIVAENNAWDVIGANASVSLEPGWNKVFVNPDLFCLENLFVMVFNISEAKVSQWQANGWKIGHFIGIEN